MAATSKWLQTQTKGRKVLVILSGGNLAHHSRNIIWRQDLLTQQPQVGAPLE